MTWKMFPLQLIFESQQVVTLDSTRVNIIHKCSTIATSPTEMLRLSTVAVRLVSIELEECWLDIRQPLISNNRLHLFSLGKSRKSDNMASQFFSHKNNGIWDK